MRTLRVAGLAAWLLIAVSGCLFDRITYASPTGNNVQLPEDRGSVVVNDHWSSASHLGAMTGDLYYQAIAQYVNAPPSYSLRAIHLADLTSRTVDGPQQQQYTEIVLSPDEQLVYFAQYVSITEAPLYVRSTTGGPADLLTRTKGVRFVGFSIGAHVMSSPDGASLAYVVGVDSLFVYTRADGVRRFVAKDCLALAAFAPDGSAVLCGAPQAGGAAKFSTVTLATGTATPLQVPMPAVANSAVMFRWDAQGIRVLYHILTEYFVADLQTSATMKVIPAMTALETIGTSFAWSPDGTAIAYHRYFCTGRLCASTQEQLMLVRLSDGYTRTVATVNHATGQSTRIVGFTPDGKQILYQLDKTVYVKLIS